MHNTYKSFSIYTQQEQSLIQIYLLEAWAAIMKLTPIVLTPCNSKSGLHSALVDNNPRGVSA